ncbi:MAG: CoA transferase [Hyphomicrobiales bacterium]|nr:CoA transferase [Hyphomicrobiales bacterium]MCP5370900.1 CoA transferase [Hyphomicrobiales bacterium]
MSDAPGNKGPLDGVLVLTLEQAVAAPFCSCRLADAGARVIKIERPVGDFARAYDRVVHGEASYFVWLNRGKESLIVDIKDAADRDLMYRILARADVFIQNLAPGAAARAGFGSADLRARFPRLVTCDISGYGEDNTYREMKAYDMLVQAESGLASITGGPEAPARVGVSACDIATGMYAHAGILEALYARERTGKGSGVSVSLFDSMADWMAVPLLHQDYGGRAPTRVGLRHPSIAPYEAFETRDGHPVLISIQNEREWARLAGQVLGHPEWATEGPFSSGVSRAAHRDDLKREIDAVFGRHTRDEIAAKLRTADIAYGFVNSVAGLSEHPALRRVRVASPTGDVDMPAPPLRHAGGEPALRPIPALGAHNDAIRKEFET